MTEPNGFTDIDFGGPATYHIVVQGSLDPSYSDRLGGMTITTTEKPDRPPHTILVGHVHDQAELSGVLDTLHNLHLSILKVEKVEEEA
jgi:hypothetical protein